MAGVGRAPKPEYASTRGHKGQSGMRVVEITPAKQPTFKRTFGDVNPGTGLPYQDLTVQLWRALKDFPTTQNMLEAQWSLLASAVMLQDAVWAGEFKWAGEARQQFAKYGITPDDVLRRRITISVAESSEIETGKKKKALTEPSRFEGLTVS